MTAREYLKSLGIVSLGSVYQNNTEQEDEQVALQDLIISHTRLRTGNAERWDSWRSLPKWKQVLVRRLGLMGKVP